MKLKNEIGGEFWITDNANIKQNNHKTKMPEWTYNLKNIVLTDSGRSALSLLLKIINPISKTVLLPIHICDSVMQPFIEAGYKIDFYKINKNFEPIDFIKSDELQFGVYVHMGYFGFLTNQSLHSYIKYLKSKNVIIVEDITHSLFSKTKHFSLNDYYVCSLRKWFALPSGGFLATNKYINYSLLKPNEEFIKLRRNAMVMKYQYVSDEKNIKKQKENYLSEFENAEKILEKNIVPRMIDDYSRQLLINNDYKEMCKKRQENFDYLLLNLSKINELDIIFKSRPDSIVPLFFPIYFKKGRDNFRKYLISKDIYCPIHWPKPGDAYSNISSENSKMYETIISIPCDQRYENNDMQRIIEEIKKYIEY
jgi:selenocysteine lyase/cysteine desulfurase